MSDNHGKFVWYDVMTTDVKAATAFYCKVVGWTAQDSGMTDRSYMLLSAGPTRIGGLMPVPDEARAAGVRPAWMGYIGVDDVDATATRIKVAGGAIHRGPEDIPGIGRFAVAGDPHGAGFIIFKGASDQVPAPVVAGTLGHIGWHELQAGDRERDFTFYASLFGWTKAEAVDMGPMGVYQTFATGGEPVGGIMTRTPETPAAFWLYYFNVDAVDAAAGRVTEGGGEILFDAHQVPGGSWIVQCMDPQGAPFALVASKR
ncbi:MAG: VOC family protein [Betaproteobacteria bacterium]